MQQVEARGRALNEGNPWTPPPGTVPDRRDRLRARLGFWKAIGTDSFTLSWIAYGKALSFAQLPDHLIFPNHPSARQAADFVAETTRAGLTDGSFVRVHPSFAKVVNPVMVEWNGKKPRLCHDIRFPNSWTATVPFRLATLARDLHTILRPGDLMMVADLEKAYYSVPMHEDSWPYLCFDGPEGLSCGTCLLFGDAQAPFTFHKITRHIVAFSGICRVRVLSYLDDFLWMAQPGQSHSTSAFAQWILPLLGWTLNNKCDWTPSTFKKFLGLFIDSAQRRLKAPFRKVRSICESMEQALKSNALQFDALTSLPGRIIALKLAIPGTRAWTRALYRCEAQARAEGAADEQLIPLTEEVREEFRFLLSHLPTWASIGMPLPPDTTDISICTDAGDFGYGGHSVNLTPRLEHAGALPPELVGRSSTCREFYALLRTAGSFRGSLKGKKVLFAMDSQPLVHCLYNEGGKVPELIELFKQWRSFLPQDYRRRPA